MAERSCIINELRQQYKTSYLNKVQLMNYFGIGDKHTLNDYLSGVEYHVIGKTIKYHVGDIATLVCKVVSK